MTIQEYMFQSGAATNYPGWRHDTEAPITSPQIEETAKPKSNFFQNVWKGAKQLLSGGVLNAFEESGRSREKGPSYTDGSEPLPYGRFTPETIHRFRLGNEFGSASYNDIFLDGFEDPAHLTFKVEFGEWGASILTDSEISATQNKALDRHVDYMDYDQMPMGLLDLNFKYKEFASMNQETYNSYNYLCNKNEDRRAQYLRDFVEGLYTIQRDFPYMFKSINGLDKLTDFDAKRGQRLKDVILKLTCLSEGIDLKIKSLLELYRKAAWDDMYQRYVLPDIMRYFKMIVYVFEARSLHMGNGVFSPDQENFPIYAYELGPCEFVIDARDTQEFTQDYSAIQTKEPVISIRVHNVKTYSANRLFQRVKFVGDIITKDQHLESNDVDQTNNNTIDWRYTWLQQMFMHHEEFKKFASWDPEFAATATDHQFADENDLSEFSLVNAASSIIVPYDQTWHFATVQDEGYQIRSLKGLWNAIKDIVTSRTQLIRDSRQSDRYYFVNDLYHIDYSTYEYMYMNHMLALDVPGAHRDMVHRIRQMLKQIHDFKMDFDESKPERNIDVVIEGEEPAEFKPEPELIPTVVSKEMHAADVSGYPKVEMIPDTSINGADALKFKPNVFIEDEDIEFELNAADVSGYPKVDMVPNAFIEGDETPHMLYPVNIEGDDAVKMTPEPSIYDIDPSFEMNAAVIDGYPKVEMTPNVSIIETSAGETQLSEMDIDDSHVKMDLYPLDRGKKPEMIDLFPLNTKTSLPDVSLMPLDTKTSIDRIDLFSLELNLSKDEMALQPLELNLLKMKHALSALEMNLEKASAALQPLDLNLMKRAQELTALILDLEKRMMAMRPLDPEEDIPQHPMSEMDQNLEIPELNMAEMDVNDETPKMNLAEMEQNLETPKFNMVELDINDETPKMNLAELQMDLEKVRLQLIELMKDASHSGVQMTPNPQDSSVGDMQLTPSDTKTSKETQQMSNIEETSVLSVRDMKPLDMETSKADIAMNVQDMSSSIEDMSLTTMDVETSIGLTALTQMDTSSNIAELRLVPQDVDTSVAAMQMQPQDMNVSIADIPLTVADIDASHNTMQMHPQDMNVSTADIQLVVADMNTSVAELQMAMMDMTAERPDMNMAQIDMSEETPQMNMTTLDVNTEDEDMQMSDIDDDTEKTDVQMASQDMDSDVPDMKLIDADVESEKSDMQLVNQDTDASLSDMKFVPQMKPDEQTYNINGGDVDVSTVKLSREEQRQRMESGRQKQPDEKPMTLQEKLDKLARLDMDLVSKAPMEELVKIIGALEEVIGDASRQMKMSNIETVSKKSRNNNRMMEMPIIKQDERGSFIAKDMIEVDDDARERAERAYARANQKKNNK